MIDKRELDLFGKDIENVVTLKKEVKYNYNEVYIYVSFDLVNSTQMKYQYSQWLNLINKLVNMSNGDWVGLNFWKFNGDELLFYAKITSLNQLVSILHTLHDKSKVLNESLRDIVLSEGNTNGIEDIIGIKTAIWMACVSDEKQALNTKLEYIDTIDFAGVNMDEGFRMSKCVVQNKFIVDPKIVFLITLLADEFDNQKISNLQQQEIEFIRNKKQRNKLTLDEKLAIFWYNQKNLDDIDHPTKDTFKSVADAFRLIGYEQCKGVWSGRNYPIIWYSDNWKETFNGVKYDEVYIGKIVDNNIFADRYKDSEHRIVTLNILKKIYNNISVFKQAIDEILVCNNFQLYSKSKLDIQIDSRTFIYYSIVCIKPDTKGVLAFLRSRTRGHLPNTWDFDQQKNAQRISGEKVITQIEDKFRNNFGVTIRVEKDKRRNSLIPIDIHPIYRRGRMHNGIMCFAYIMDDKSEEEIINTIKSKLDNVVSGYGYSLYSDVKFIHREDTNLMNSTCLIDGQEIAELTYEEAYIDSNTWNVHEKLRDTKCMTNFVITVVDAVNYETKKV